MSSMPELVQSALSALRHLQPTDRATAVAILNLWAHVAEIDVDQVVNYYFTGNRTDVTVVADGHLVSHCCGRVDDEPHRNFCEHYRPAAGAPECPDWCVEDHSTDDARDDLVLHMGDDHTDGSVRKLLDAHALDVRVARTDDLTARTAGIPSLMVRLDAELTTWEQAGGLVRTILDGFGYLHMAGAR
jgi:hypothetical protein